MTGRALDPLRADVERYYSGRLAEHGPTHSGADWNSRESQELRFAQLLHPVAGGGDGLSLLDYGCGYGALVEFLERNGPAGLRYRGFDISQPMVETARGLYGDRANVSFTTDEASLEPADHVVASGLFNVRLDRSEDEWAEYVEATVDRIAALSRRSFAFNMLTSYSDPERMRPDLHYADPLRWFDRCKRRYSRHVALLHDYGLYEFTIAVRLEAERA